MSKPRSKAKLVCKRNAVPISQDAQPAALASLAKLLLAALQLSAQESLDYSHMYRITRQQLGTANVLSKPRIYHINFDDFSRSFVLEHS